MEKTLPTPQLQHCCACLQATPFLSLCIARSKFSGKGTGFSLEHAQPIQTAAVPPGHYDTWPNFQAFPTTHFQSELPYHIVVCCCTAIKSHSKGCISPCLEKLRGGGKRGHTYQQQFLQLGELWFCWTYPGQT